VALSPKTRAEDLRAGSQVQSRGGSDTLALPGGTKHVRNTFWHPKLV